MASGTAVDWLAWYPQQGKIAVNDMSLPFGGLFDILRNWQPPHHRHDWGTAVDVRGNGALYSVPPDKVDQFAGYCREHGASFVLVESRGTSNQHIHCEWPY